LTGELNDHAGFGEKFTLEPLIALTLSALDAGLPTAAAGGPRLDECQ